MEELRRHIIWQANKKFIDEHNALADKFGYTLALNMFSDLETAEFSRIYNGYRPALRSSNVTRKLYKAPPPDPSLNTATVDWRNKGVVTPVKNQGQCGSCWAFSTTGSVEGQHALKTGNLVSLSEQDLVDCSTSYGNEGCNGGLMDNAFKYIIAKGDDTEESYPYTAEDGTCRYNPDNVGARISSYTDIPSGSESALQTAARSIGPISVAIDASHASFQSYESGVYYEPDCSTEQLDHGVLVVGYGTTSDGVDYWLVKNSWGAAWGMDGYIMMSRNRDNNCGIATEASYPTV